VHCSFFLQHRAGNAQCALAVQRVQSQQHSGALGAEGGLRRYEPRRAQPAAHPAQPTRKWHNRLPARLPTHLRPPGSAGGRRCAAAAGRARGKWGPRARGHPLPRHQTCRCSWCTPCRARAVHGRHIDHTQRPALPHQLTRRCSWCVLAAARLLSGGETGRRSERSGECSLPREAQSRGAGNSDGGLPARGGVQRGTHQCMGWPTPGSQKV
jgi:hypothetical protein